MNLKLKYALVLTLFGATAVGAALPGCIERPAEVTKTPAPFDKYMVFMAAGTYDPDDPDYTAPSGEYFQKVIMDRSEADMLEERSRALAFFEQRFGIDPLAPGSGVTFEFYMIDPRNQTRAYTISGERVPSEGWVVRDGGWKMEVVDPAGVSLGGELSGQVAPVNAFMVFGEYNIRTTSSVPKDEYDPRAIVMHYESPYPLVPDERGDLMFLCDLESEAYGRGVAQGIAAPTLKQGGLVQANIRNVITVPSYGASVAAGPE